MTRVLALDLATKVGWALGSVQHGCVGHGVIQLPKKELLLRQYVVPFRKWLGEAIEQLAPGEIIYEMPVLSKAMSLIAVRKLNGLCTIAELVAHDYGIAISEARLITIRRHFIGTEKAPAAIKSPNIRRMWLKRKTVEECHARGFRVVGDDDADALALLSLRLSQLSDGYVLRQFPEQAAA